MESTLFIPYQVPRHFTLAPSDMYNQGYLSGSPMTQHPPFMRSSAPQTLHPPSPHQYYVRSYHPSPAEAYHNDEHSSSPSSSNSNGQSAHILPKQEYQEPNYQLGASPGALQYPMENSIPRNMSWVKEDHGHYGHIQTTAVESHLPNGGRYQDPQLQYFEPSPEAQYAATEISSYYDGQAEALSREPTLTEYTAQGNSLPSVIHSFTHSPRLDADTVSQEQQQQQQQQPSSPESVYSTHLHYPTTPDDVTPQFVNMQDISPSPGVSPDQVYSTLPVGSSPYASPALSYVVAEPATLSSPEYDDTRSEAVYHLNHTVHQPSPPIAPAPTRKRRREESDEREASPLRHAAIDSGESEREDDADDADDDEYTPEARGATRSSARRKVSMRNMQREVSPVDIERPRLAPPVPVPNLTKKSRGRRVPTSSALVSQNGVEKTARGYKCKVAGCNKCFQRGEHLKRHVRSIHTNEKPHKCPYKSCGKDFSRHDNLRQHMRVHRNDPLDSDGTAGSA